MIKYRRHVSETKWHSLNHFFNKYLRDSTLHTPGRAEGEGYRGESDKHSNTVTGSGGLSVSSGHAEEKNGHRVSQCGLIMDVGDYLPPVPHSLLFWLDLTTTLCGGSYSSFNR